MRFLISLISLASLSLADGFRVQTVAYRQDSTALEGVFVSPSSAKAGLPGIVLFPDWMGVTPEAVASAKRVAQWGYAVFVADVYGQGVRPKNAEEAGKLAGSLKGDIPLLRRRAASALITLKRQAGVDSLKTADLGFCFGGGAALELARSGAMLKASISVHGNLNTPSLDDAKQIKAKVLVLHGADDPYVPAQQVQNFMDEMRHAGVDWELVQLGGAVHAFTNPKAGSDPKQGAAFNPKADKRAFEAMKAFFAETL